MLLFSLFLCILCNCKRLEKMKENCWEAKNCGRELNGAKKVS